MNVCVYCGSSNGKNPKIKSFAQNFGHQLAQHGHNLVYGGASIGIMGVVADSVMQNNGKVYGVIPGGLFQKEVAHQNITQLYVVKTMHERKAKMAQLSDAFVALPGGFGTLEELFEIITWNQIGILKKPVILINYAGFYQKLINMIYHAADEGFIRSENLDILQIADSVDDFLRLLDFNK